MGEIAVAIADDNERILDLLGEMIENNKEMKLVGKANNGEDVYTLIKEKQPDVVLLDLIMPKMDGLSVMDTVNRDHDIRKHPSFIIITARLRQDAECDARSCERPHAQAPGNGRLQLVSAAER